MEASLGGMRGARQGARRGSGRVRSSIKVQSTRLRLRSIWNGVVNKPYLLLCGADPIVRQWRDALEAHRQRMGVWADPDFPIFQSDLHTDEPGQSCQAVHHPKNRKVPQVSKDKDPTQTRGASIRTGHDPPLARLARAPTWTRHNPSPAQNSRQRNPGNPTTQQRSHHASQLHQEPDRKPSGCS